MGKGRYDYGNHLCYSRCHGGKIRRRRVGALRTLLMLVSQMVSMRDGVELSTDLYMPAHSKSMSFSQVGMD